VGARPSALCVTQKFKKNILLKIACQNYFLFSLYLPFINPLLTRCPVVEERRSSAFASALMKSASLAYPSLGGAT
jgi:hypothetical protein